MLYSYIYYYLVKHSRLNLKYEFNFYFFFFFTKIDLTIHDYTLRTAKNINKDVYSTGINNYNNLIQYVDMSRTRIENLPGF